MRINRYLFILSLSLSVALPLNGAQENRERKNKDQEKLRQEEVADYYKKWLNEDVLYIISDEEKSVFSKLTTPEEKEQFVEQFWVRRDPDPRSSINEFKIEHYRRIAYSNEKFTSGDPGWKTDRGRVYIIHGPPDSQESRPDGGLYMRPIEEGGGRTVVHPYEKWRYRYIEGIGQDVELEFVDKTNTGHYELAVYPWEKDALLHIGEGQTLAEELGMAKRADHPALIPGAGGAGFGPQTYFRRLRDLPFARYEQAARIQAAPIVKYKDLKELVKVNVTYKNVPFEVRHDYFKLNEAQVLVPFTLRVNSKDLTFKEQGKTVMAKVAVYGIITSMTNRIAAEFENDFFIAHTPEGLQKGVEKIAMYQKILTLEQRMRYRLDLVVKDLNSGNVGVLQAAIIPPAFGEEKLDASSVILSNHVKTLEKVPEQDEMFVLGDVKILPNVEKSFTPQMPLGVYFQVYNSAIDSSSLAPSLLVTYKLLKDGELLKEATDENGESMQYFSPHRVVLLKQLSLTDLQPGKYQIQVEVVDRLTERKVTLTENFSLTL